MTGLARSSKMFVRQGVRVLKQIAFPAGIALSVALIVFAQFAPLKSALAGSLPSRDFEFRYVVHVPALHGGGHVMRIWLPLPPEDAHQEITDLRISSPVPYRIYRQLSYGDRLAFFQFYSVGARTPFDIRLTFRARRYEYRVALPSRDPAPSPDPFPPEVAFFLRPDRLVPITGIIAELSHEQTEGISDPLAKARKIYDYVISSMHYDHRGTGWGRGDAIFACTTHHGNCTDFHSLFIGMARAAGIPARFEIGFSLPPEQGHGKIDGYHCWAEFYIRGIGWVPLDASEAWLMPAKHDYFFGALDPNRVRLSRGRDLHLIPAQKAGAVNYFVYPYAELDGEAIENLRHEFYFRDLSFARERTARSGGTP